METQLENVCKLRKKTKECPNPASTLLNCWNTDCKNWIHQPCCELLLDNNSVNKEDRPTADEQTANGEPVVFCMKSCYNKWKREKKAALKDAKKRKYIPWEDDGTIEVLMDWLTTHGNYANYCGANGNKGFTKAHYQKEIAILIKEKLPLSDRSEKDVENKIGKLERDFRVATDWANNTGAGVEDTGTFRNCIIQRCRYYYELEDIMGERPNATPLATNEESEASEDELPIQQNDEEEEEDEDEEEPVAIINATSTTETPLRPTTAVENNNEKEKEKASAKTTTTKKRLSAGNTNSSKSSKRGKGKPKDAGDLVSGLFGDTNFKELREREVVAMERQAEARMLEAQANCAKSNKETAILTITEKVNLLRERKKLLDEGICTEAELEEYLPLLNTNNESKE